MKRKLILWLLHQLSKHTTGRNSLALRFEYGGHLYYGHKRKMPPKRYSRLLRQYNLLVTGLSEESYVMCLDGVVEAFKGGLSQYESEKTTKRLTKAMALLFEMQDRVAQPSCAVIVDMLALSYVREDEDEKEYDHGIHLEKIEAINELLETNVELITNTSEYNIFGDSGISHKVLSEMISSKSLTDSQIISILAS